MTKANTQSCNRFDFSIIFTIKNIIGGWPDKFQEMFLKALKLPIFEKVMFCVEKGFVFSISSSVRGFS